TRSGPRQPNHVRRTTRVLHSSTDAATSIADAECRVALVGFTIRTYAAVAPCREEWADGAARMLSRHRPMGHVDVVAVHPSGDELGPVPAGIVFRRRRTPRPHEEQVAVEAFRQVPFEDVERVADTGEQRLDGRERVATAFDTPENRCDIPYISHRAVAVVEAVQRRECHRLRVDGLRERG